MATYRTAVDLTWSGASGSPGVNTWHGRTVAIDQTIDIEEQMIWVRDFYTELTSLWNNDVVIHWNGEAFGVGDDEGEMWTGTPWTVNGSGGTDHLAPANCILVQWRTAGGGRHGRGRSFLGPLQDAVSESNGTPDEGVRTDVSDAAATLIASSTGSSNGALGVYSRSENVFRDFVSATVPNYFAVLRSRRD